jgi:hypothetical protein
MAKAIVSVSGMKLIGDVVQVGYSVAVIGTPNVVFKTGYNVDTGISVAANITAWKNKIIAEVATYGSTIIVSDIITFGSPV